MQITRSGGTLLTSSDRKISLMLRSQRVRVLARAHRAAGAEAFLRLVSIPHAESSKHALARARCLRDTFRSYPYGSAARQGIARRSFRTYASARAAVIEADMEDELDALDSAGLHIEDVSEAPDLASAAGEAGPGLRVWKAMTDRTDPYSHRPIGDSQYKRIKWDDITEKRSKARTPESRNAGIKVPGWRRFPEGLQYALPESSQPLLASPRMLESSSEGSDRQVPLDADHDIVQRFLDLGNVSRSRLPYYSITLLDRLSAGLQRLAAADRDWWRQEEWQTGPSINLTRCMLKLRAMLRVLPTRQEAASTSFAYIRSINLHLFCQLCFALGTRDLLVSTLGKAIKIEGLIERYLPAGEQLQRRKLAATRFSPYIHACINALLNNKDQHNVARLWRILERNLPGETVAVILGRKGFRAIMTTFIKTRRPHEARHMYEVAQQFLGEHIENLMPGVLEALVREGDVTEAQKVLSGVKDLSREAYSDTQFKMLRGYLTLGFDEAAELRILEDIDADRLDRPAGFLNLLIALRMRARHLEAAKRLFARFRLTDTAIGVQDERRGEIRPLLEPNNLTRQLALEWVMRAGKVETLMGWWKFIRKDTRVQTDRIFAGFIGQLVTAGYYDDALSLFLTSAGVTEPHTPEDPSEEPMLAVSRGPDFAPVLVTPSAVLSPIPGFRPGPKTSRAMLQQAAFRRNHLHYQAAVLAMQKIGLTANEAIFSTFFPLIADQPYVSADDMAAVAHAMTSLSGMPESPILLDIVLRRAVDLMARPSHQWMAVSKPYVETDESADESGYGGLKALESEENLMAMINNVSRSGARTSYHMSATLLRFDIAQQSAKNKLAPIQDAWGRFLKQGYKPNTIHIIALIHGLTSANRRDHIPQVLRLAESLDIPINRDMLRLYLRSIFSGPRSAKHTAHSPAAFKMALQAYEQIRGLGADDPRQGIDAQTIEIMLYGCGRFRRWDVGQQIIQRELPALRPLHASTERAVFEFYLSQQGWVHKALDWLDSSSAQGRLDAETVFRARATRAHLEELVQQGVMKRNGDDRVIERLEGYLTKFEHSQLGHMNVREYLAKRDARIWWHRMRIAEMLVRLNRPIKPHSITHRPPGLGRSYQKADFEHPNARKRHPSWGPAK